VRAELRLLSLKVHCMSYSFFNLSCRSLKAWTCPARTWRGPGCHSNPICGRRQSADTWACGVMLFIMLASAYPFGRPEDEQLKPSAKMHVMLQVRHCSTQRLASARQCSYRAVGRCIMPALRCLARGEHVRAVC